MSTSQLHLAFEDEGPVEAAQLGHYLFLFRAAYAAALPLVRDFQEDVGSLENSPILVRLRKRLHRLNISSVDALFTKNLGDSAPIAVRISRESPLEIVMVGIIGALSLAAILSGGKVKFEAIGMKVDVQLPPIGEGIKRLREAFGGSTKTRLTYGVKSRMIKLSKVEFNELMKYDPSTEKRGGFQRLLIGMQVRVNRRTRELLLTDHEMDMIIRHGRQPGKGGWQHSLKVIFGRHFDLGAA